MQYSVQIQNFNRLSSSGSDTWSSSGSTGHTGSRSGGSTGGTATYFTVLDSRVISGFSSEAAITVGELKTLVNTKYSNTNTLYSLTVLVGGTAAADSLVLDKNDSIVYNAVYTPVLKKYRRSTLPTPLPRPGVTGPAEAAKETGSTGATGS
jgi:hypothetical protein